MQQVPEWNPDLIEIEDQAKQIAQLLMFVVDNTTRSVASLVEAAYFAGNSINYIPFLFSKISIFDLQLFFFSRKYSC